mmetsp:Transcript_54529/g.162920  ORF Transcript_54529/g.162920 Transcript_54529/m.162920 type:complete len:444 (-) Transcript_54529:493-1824(-)
MRLHYLAASLLLASAGSGSGGGGVGVEGFAFPAASRGVSSGAFFASRRSHSHSRTLVASSARRLSVSYAAAPGSSASEGEDAFMDASMDDTAAEVYSSDELDKEDKEEEDEDEDDDLPKAPGHDLGILLTWDLDDTLYPLTPVIGRANIAFSMMMSKLGYTDVSPRDISRTVKEIRSEYNDDPELFPPTYVQLRTKAIRREMVRFITRKNLEAVAVDEGTDVEKLTGPIVTLAETKAQRSLDNSAVRAVYDAWESERHAAADANVYPDVAPMLKRLKRDYPHAVMGAVTNGAANPLKMPLTLAPRFDFSVSWGDDGIARKPDRAIYEAALERYKEFAPEDKPMRVWIHIGDDLAYDVGGSSAVGAKTIWTDLTEDYGQTAEARLWVDDPATAERPAWSTAPEEELVMRKKLAEGAKDRITATVSQMSQIPDAVRRIVRDVLDE